MIEPELTVEGPRAAAPTDRPRTFLFTAVCVALGLVGACSIDPEPSGPRVSNDTQSTVSLLIERNGKTTPMGGVSAGTTVYLYEFRDTCTDGTLIAIAPDGDEVGRREEPLCSGEVWSVSQ